MSCHQFPVTNFLSPICCHQFPVISCHFLSPHFLSFPVISCRWVRFSKHYKIRGLVISCHFLSFPVAPFPVISCRPISCHVLSFSVISCHFLSLIFSQVLSLLGTLFCHVLYFSVCPHLLCHCNPVPWEGSQGKQHRKRMDIEGQSFEEVQTVPAL